MVAFANIPLQCDKFKIKPELKSTEATLTVFYLPPAFCRIFGLYHHGFMHAQVTLIFPQGHFLG